MSIILPSFAGIAKPSGGGAAFLNQYSVSHDGLDDYINLTSSISFTGAFTISTWIKPSGSGTRMFLGKLAGTNFYIYIGNTGGLTIVIASGSGLSTSGVTVSNDTWYNIIIIRDASNNVTIYVNGVSRATGSRSGTATTNVINHPSYAYSGLIDEVAMWDSDQTANLASIYNSGVPSDLSTLSPLHWWRMGDNDSGTGTTITDQGVDSGGNPNGNDATIVNGSSGNTSPTYSTDVPS